MVCKGLPYTLLIYKFIQSNQPHRGHSLAGLPRLVLGTTKTNTQQLSTTFNHYNYYNLIQFLFILHINYKKYF